MIIMETKNTNDELENVSNVINSMEKVELSGYILKTTNYDNFKALQGNRVVDPCNVKKIKESISDIGYKKSQPIIVDEDLQIVDGQHRFTACKELGLPIYFTIEPTNNESIKITQKFNKDQKNWGAMDFLRSYAERGFKDYIRFLDYMEKNNVKQDVLLILINGAPSPNVTAKIREGALSFGDEEIKKADYYLTRLKDIQNAIPNSLEVDKIIYNRIFLSKTCTALRRIMKCDNYNHKRMVNQVALNYKSLDFRNIQACGESFVTIYNNKLQQNNRLPLFIDMR